MSSGRTSGSGFAIAKTIASSAIERIASAETAPGPETPRKTSAPASASSAVPSKPRGFVFFAYHFWMAVRPFLLGLSAPSR
jgi:hypothetical protein